MGNSKVKEITDNNGLSININMKKENKQTQFPYSDRVVVRKIDVEYKSKGGIILGEIEKDAETMFGRVIAVGRGKWLESGIVPMETEVGDIVVMVANAPRKINIKGEYFYIINESNLLEKIVDSDLVEKEFKTEGYEFEASGTKILN